VRRAPAGVAGLRIAQVSDFHFRRWNRVFQAAQELLLSLEYDLLVATGDLAADPAHWAHAAKLIRRFFDPIAERVPAYAVLGNHDSAALATAPGMPLTFLINESVSIERAGLLVELAGVDQSLDGHENLSAALGATDPHDLRILLAHYPSTVFRLPAGRIDVQLSGHTHGGQIRFPWLGCVWANDRISPRMARGVHDVAGTILHTSAGIGVSMFLPIRVNCPPEVVLLSIRTGHSRLESSCAPHFANTLMP
jgi:hypothetical protein